MFVFQSKDLPADPVFPADLEKLGWASLRFFLLKSTTVKGTKTDSTAMRENAGISSMPKTRSK